MKKSIFIVALLAGIVLISCKSNTEKEADAMEDVQEANENMDSISDDVKNDAISKANDIEWQTYKSEANNTINTNEERIAELKIAIKKTGNTFDASYRKSINDLENKNASLKNKISDYENNQTDWASFKREFDSDMTELGQAFKDLTVNNKK